MKNEYKVSIGVEGVEDEYRWRMSVEVSIDEEGIKVKEVWEDWSGDWSEVEWISQVKFEVNWSEELKNPRSEV